ncbi:AAA family ATPase [Vreelandella alkaliphila]|uniref:AAA family ATPase n=1 Tax=Vreelandella alkaliphila TaxID=272774 RepID=UPI003FD8C550
MKIKKVEIEGFRAYKLKENGTFDFTIEGDKPSNFVAIYAPNGFGKSSFYDAVEWALTNHLERLGGSHNKKNHDLAAKSTKQKGIAQKILRNKDVADEIPTCVSVSTTWKMFERTLPRPRSNSRDLPILENRKKEADYFREVILTQDAIDRFLREAKPQDRYAQFMEYFGGDAEQARQELTALINDNNAVLQGLRSQRADLEEKLKEPVAESIFDQFNSLASSLNEEGECVPLVSPDFSTHKEHEILAFIVTRTHELTALRNAREKSRESLNERLSRLPEVQQNLDLIAEQQPRLAKLSKGVVDAQRYQSLLESHSKCLEDLQFASQQLEKLLEIKGLVPAYLAAEAEIKTATEQQEVLAKQRSDQVAAINELEAFAKHHSDNLVAADQRALLLRTTIGNSSSIYAEIATHQAGLAALHIQSSEKDVTLSLGMAEREAVEDELEKVSAIKIDAAALLTQDVSLVGIDRAKLIEIDSLAKELKTLGVHDQAIRQTQDALNQQMGLHERLISIGLEYMSTWPTDTCPLCHKEHSSPTDLRKAVEKNDLVSSLVKENAQKLEESSERQKALKSRLDSIAHEAVTLQNKRLADLREKLNELGAKIYSSEQEKASILAEIDNTKKRIKALQDRVWNLEKDELERRVEVELKSLAMSSSEHLSQLTQINLQIKEKKSQLASVSSTLNVLRVRVEEISSGSAYEKVKSYIEEKGTSPDEVDVYCAEKIKEFRKLKENCDRDSSEVVGQCKILRTEMLTDETWIDFVSLSAQKEETEKKIAKSTSFIDSFFETMPHFIGQQTDNSIDAVRDQISKSIDTLNEQSKELDAKLIKFDLLSEQLKAFKPYLNSLVLQESLTITERNLAQREQVDEKLTAERNLVLAKLKERIGDFFFTDLINAIYSKIDPHPSFKEVEFLPDFDLPDRPGLNVVLNNGDGDSISPILYFSAAQLNILSLSVFLANALHATDYKGTPLGVILIDDPIQSMDSINVLATIDLLRSISVRFDKQIIISTHDENFFGLLQRKIPSEVFSSKFLQLESFGVVAPVEPLLN